MTMTPDAKSELSKTIRKIRERLLIDLHDANERAYRLGVPIAKAKLNEEATIRRQRMEAWIDEQIRAETGDEKRDAMAFRRDIEKQAAYTFLNRIVILRLMEAWDLRGPAVATKGWDSKGYKDFRQLARSLVQVDTETEGFGFLLKLIFEDLATDLPGLYGSNGLADQVPIPPATMRFVIESLDEPVMDSCWTDDMTLGWVYQYWNDPEREALDAKINDGGKIEPHEIASKTQMFTERYMVDWLLQNSLGPMWLAICKKHGWTPDAESTGTLDELEKRRVEWRAKRDAGEVELTDLMPLHTDLERQWAYYVPQPIPDDAVEHANDSVRDLKILDPAVGSGHFLVAAFDLLHALYQEEARHRGVDQADLEDPQGQWSDQAIVERILEHNLNGIDLDSRAVQIAAAALWMKAKLKCESAHPANLNLVASNLGIARLPHNDPALVELRRAVEEETGIPANLTNQIIEALQGADHLGSLLKVDTALDEAISQYEKDIGWENNTMQLKMFPDGKIEQEKLPFGKERVKANLLSEIESFLDKHSTGSELGLRLRGQELASGVRFIRINSENKYDVVVANPPYQGTSKLRDAHLYKSTYPLAPTDLFAGMTVRALQLLRPSGVCAMIALSNWMFTKSFIEFRSHVLTHHLTAIADFGKAAFSTGGTLISTACYVVRNTDQNKLVAVGIRPMSPSEVRRDSTQPMRTECALRLHRGRHDFTPYGLKLVPEWPLVYWWPTEMLEAFNNAPLLGEVSPSRAAQSTGNNPRFVRFSWEVNTSKEQSSHYRPTEWKPFVNGAEGRAWLDPFREVINWAANGLPIKASKCHKTNSITCSLASEQYFLKRRGISYSTIGAHFSARVHRKPSVFGNASSSVFPESIENTVCAMNTSTSRNILSSLNPSVNFEVGDVNRLPVFQVADSEKIFRVISKAFDEHEACQEISEEFRSVGPSPWRYAQEWAQRAIDRKPGSPLPTYEPQMEPEDPTDHLSHAIGIALGRFSGESHNAPSLKDGLLFLNGSLADNEFGDSLGQPAAKIIHDNWSSYGSLIAPRLEIRDWLRLKFFSDVHKEMYQNRPIYWPISSARRTFVAFVSIHRFTEQTLRVLLADHLGPSLTSLDGELEDIKTAKDASGKKSSQDVEERYSDVKKWRNELVDFIKAVQECAEKGPPSPDTKSPEREVDSKYIPVLDDGVMISSSALWPLLEPQWKDPKKWWTQLAVANPKGNKDYDWSKLAMNYYPERVDAKCKVNSSLAQAHGCLWKYHNSRAWAWEIRLQDEISPDFRIDEGSYLGDGGHAAHRCEFLRDKPNVAFEMVEKEALRRLKNASESMAEMKLLESGIWSALPEKCWNLETKIIKKQEVEFRLVAPDEKKARKELLKKKPDLKKKRKELLDKYKTLFAEEPDEEVTA